MKRLRETSGHLDLGLGFWSFGEAQRIDASRFILADILTHIDVPSRVSISR